MQAATAIADPVRREILELLLAGPAPAGSIAARFAISRPAISRHLRVLRECGLVTDRLIGRQRMYSLDTRPLLQIAEWIGRFDAADGWERRLDALETEVARTRRERSATTKPDRPGAAHGGAERRSEETA
ncbi:MAG: metalloregulator ArsR/SmtB family transcription factor [Nakamurella sp.]